MPQSTELWVAIPDSALSEQGTKRDKSMMVSQIARACSIFRVTRIYIYHDKTTKFTKVDLNLLKIILKFLNTPPYLRKLVYPMVDQLQFSGLLHPIIAPHHKPIQNLREVTEGEVRVGLIVQRGGTLYANVGLGDLVRFKGNARVDSILNLKFMAGYPHQYVVEASAEDIGDKYWGYEVLETVDLTSLLSNQPNALLLFTSRAGVKLRKIEGHLIKRLRSAQNLLVIFGAPKSGLAEILKNEKKDIRSFEFVVNSFPMQGTRTVRLEEAILGTLAIVNHILIASNGMTGHYQL
jgi:predicted SPOUT superfamily RNA methylase MTH1